MEKNSFTATGYLLVLIVLVSSISLLDISTNYAFGASPTITAYVGNDPDDGDAVFGAGDTLTITTDIPTNATVGAVTNAAFVTGNFTFASPDPLASLTFTTDWTAEWTDASNLVITFININNVPVVSTSTVDTTGGNTIGDQTADDSGMTNGAPDVLSGDFGLFVAATTTTSNGSGCDGDCEEPTLGVNEDGRRIVEDGFTYNGKSIDVERYFTPYPLVTVQTGKQNVAEFKIYDNMGPENISHFELAFGLANGESIGMSNAVINWDKTWDGIETVTLDDPENVLDNIRISTSEGNCSEELQQKCLIVKVVHTFRAPLDFNILGTNVWDAKRNAWQNFYNHGIEVVGESLNPPKELFVASVDREHRGLVHITQIDSLNQIWETDDGYKYQMNDFGTFVLIEVPEKEQIIDVGNPDNRNHSAFELLKEYETIRAAYYWNADDYVSELKPSFAYEFPIEDSRTKFLKENGMLSWVKGD